MLVPHAFYYSIRGPRIDERPPDVGPNSPWWDQYKPFADASRRMCWLNTDNRHVCSLAILGQNDYLPWQAAKVCFQSQRDFNYLEACHLWEDARVDSDGIHIAGMHYKAMILEFDPPSKAKKTIQTLEEAGRIIRWNKNRASLLKKIDSLIPLDVDIFPKMWDVRVRHVIKEGMHFFIVFNEGQKNIMFRLRTLTEGRRFEINPETGRQIENDPHGLLQMQPHELKIFRIEKV
jgi:hypothetical protein